MDQTIYITGPLPKTKLIYSDVWLPPIYSRRILCFSQPDSSTRPQALEALRQGLQALVNGTPDLGGVVNIVPPDNEHAVPWRAIQPGKGIVLVVRDLTDSFVGYSELEETEFPVTEFKDGILMPVPVSSPPSGNQQMLVQLNFVEGGMLVSFALFHSLTDGNGMNAVMAALGEECKLAAAGQGSVPRVLDTDRSLLASVEGSKTDVKDHPAYEIMKDVWLPELPEAEKKPTDGTTNEPDQPVKPAEPTATAAESPTPQATTHIYRLTSASALAIKEGCTSSENPLTTTHDAISALIWRTTILARYGAGRIPLDQPCTFTVPHNSRRHVGLAKDWVGNCVYFVTATLPCHAIIAENSLPVLAAAIRQSLNAVNSDVVGGLMHLRKPDTYSVTWWPLHQANEPWIVAITSFYHSELLMTDWGSAFGRVQHFTTSDEGVIGGFRKVGCVGAKLREGEDAGRGCDVVLGLDGEEEEGVARDEVWGRYMKETGR